MLAVDLPRLRQLIGRRVSFHGNVYTVVEILEDGPAIIIVADHPKIIIQPDSHGYARRQIAQTLTIPTVHQGGPEPHPDFLEIQLI